MQTYYIISMIGKSKGLAIIDADAHCIACPGTNVWQI